MQFLPIFSSLLISLSLISSSSASIQGSQHVNHNANARHHSSHARMIENRQVYHSNSISRARNLSDNKMVRKAATKEQIHYQEKFNKMNSEWQAAAQESLKNGQTPQDYNSFSKQHGGVESGYFSDGNSSSGGSSQTSSDDDSDDSKSSKSDSSSSKSEVPSNSKSDSNTNKSQSNKPQQQQESSSKSDTNSNSGSSSKSNSNDDDDSSKSDNKDQDEDQECESESNNDQEDQDNSSSSSKISHSTPSSTSPTSTSKSKAQSKPSSTSSSAAPKNTASTKNNDNSNSNSGSSKSGGSGILSGIANIFHGGQGTFFNPGLGSCGGTNSDSDYIVALSAELMNSFSTGNPNHNPACGKKIKVEFEGKTVEAEVVDTCPPCSRYSIDLSPAAFNQIANPDLGRINLNGWGFTDGTKI